MRQALAYALQGSCDSHLHAATGVSALAAYGDADLGAARHCVEDGVIFVDVLDGVALRRWVDGADPTTGTHRGRQLTSPEADLILDGTINAPKSFSIAALIDPVLATEFEALQDRLRDRIISLWQRELNARRGAGGRVREQLHRIEVVELQHRRSRALDPHVHRHLWLNVKVQGVDRRWSNIDSRAAMKMHTLINAEGDLAARTDRQWIAALASRGYTLNGDGEIAELAHAVRPLSRRSNQIAANRAVILAGWRSEHPGVEPSFDEARRIDRLAWATARPGKPDAVDEAEWTTLITDELAAIDPQILQPRSALPLSSTPLQDLDLDLLAARAVVDADARATSCGGRFSLFDVRAGAVRAVAASGVVEDRARIDGTIREVACRALGLTVDLLDGTARPPQVKGYLASATAGLKAELAAHLEALSQSGRAVDHEEINDAAARARVDHVILDGRQVAAAAAIAGTDRLVSVTGPAGAGKTTMLRIAQAALSGQGRRMLVVAPTKKAASVAGREIGAFASSLHALLADHGWRWTRDDAGGEVWAQLAVGEIDPTTRSRYGGPRRFPLGADDRIVVDEAGMVDLSSARALAILARQTGASIAMVGDPLQAQPVGHSGAMASLTRRATAVVELTSVHRFADRDYAALTLRMREPASIEAARDVATELDARGLVRRVADADTAREAMVDAYLQRANSHHRMALVASTNEEAHAINEAIQDRRLSAGSLSLARIAVGAGEQRLLEGDVVQTRRNDREAGVENRVVWTIRRITAERVELVSVDDSTDVRSVSTAYAAEHVHLAYASTVHGIQGETTAEAIVGPGVDAAGLYVGMTRGRLRNEVIVIAHTDRRARHEVAEVMRRGLSEVTIDDSFRAARVELRRAARDPLELEVAQQARDRPPSPRANDLARRKDWLESTRLDLIRLDAAIERDRARHHARGHDVVAGDDVAHRDELFAVYRQQLDRYVGDIRRQVRGRPAQQEDRIIAAAPPFLAVSDAGLSR